MRSIEISIPGKVMLSGEYVALKGFGALVIPTQARMRMVAKADPQATKWVFRSCLWQGDRTLPCWETSTQYSISKGPEAMALATWAELLERNRILGGGFVEIDDGLDVRSGLGSSSALRLGLVTLARTMACKDHDPEQCARDAYELQKQDQVEASGYDVACQWKGRLIEFKHDPQSQSTWPESIQERSSLFADVQRHLHVFVGGSGAPTKETIRVQKDWLEQKQAWPQLTTLDALWRQALLGLGQDISRAVNRCRELMEFWQSSPAFPSALFSELNASQGYGSRWAAKTTGAGGLDALLVVASPADIDLAKSSLEPMGWYPLLSPFAERGIEFSYLTEDQKRAREGGSELHLYS